MNKIVKIALPTILILTMLWSALGVWNNLSKNNGAVSFEWIDGRFEIIYDDEGAEPRPLLSTMDFLVNIGETGKNLVEEVAFACQRLIDNINPDILDETPSEDLEWYEAFLVWMEYIVNILIALVQIILELCLLLVRVALWLVALLPNILGFLLTGAPLYDMNAIQNII